MSQNKETYVLARCWGAYWSLYLIIASKSVGLNGKVIAIEADPENFNILNRNIQLNKLTNVIALNYAAYSKEDKIRLYLLKIEDSSYTKYNTSNDRQSR